MLLLERQGKHLAYKNPAAAISKVCPGVIPEI